VQASGRGHRGGRLIVVSGGFSTFDPALVATTTSNVADGLVYDGLTAVRRTGGAEGTQIVPDLATTLPSPTNGGRTYTFRLRPGIRYSNGQPVRPEDIRRGLERYLALSGFPASDWKIVGASACSKRACDLSGGVVTGPGTVTIRLTEPNPRLLLQLAAVSPAPPGTPLRAVSGKGPPGTGPYLVESLVPDREATLVRNPRFRVWSPAARPDGYPDEIVWRLGVGKDAVDDVASGRSDVLLAETPPARLPELKTRYPSQLHLAPQNATTFLFLNTRQPPFDDIRVRRALDFAVDRAKAAALEGGPDLAQPTCQLVPPTLPGYVRYCPYAGPDLEQAKRLVAASGTRGQTVVVWSMPYFDGDARYVVSLLQQLGYRARLKRFPDLSTYFGTLEKTHPQAGFAGWFGLQLPSDIFETLGCALSQNWADFCDRGVDREVQRLIQLQASDPEAAAKLAAKIDRTLVDRAPWVPLWTPRLVDFVSRRVGNYQFNAYDSTLLDQLWVR
jgi:peptide/nickel transport system substrate-binding protein